MAEVDFGDSELFQQLDEDRPVATHLRFETDEDAPEKIHELRERLEECEETINRLNAENEELRRKLKTVTPPSGVKVDNTRTDGPLLHVLYGNNNISKECRQEIEDSICGLIEKHQQQKNTSQQTTCYVPPQASSFFLEDEQRDKSSDTLKKIKEAFSVVGSVLYFTSFCLDKLGQPLLNDNPQLTDGWEVPKYPQVFSGVMTLDGQELQIKERRPKPCCFNCGGEDHQLRDCPKPKDMARINEKRKEFSQGNNNIVGGQRYHFEEVEERFLKYKPGVVSQDLLDALGVSANKVPPFIYRMRELGYPPGWLKEAEEENSGLQLYDGNASGEAVEEENGHGQKVSYDLSKLVDFPGFNVGLPPHVKDEYRAYGSVPMQYQHMKQNFAAYLSTNYPTSGSSNSKRRHESESTPRHSKKRRSNPDSSRCSDMDLDSDQDSICPPGTKDGFQFQPPLPRNSPSFSSPPPLPPGTPPVTPTPPPLPKGTPPTNGSPALEREGSEDGLTLEELEEQQRLLWAALEKADTATNSDSETGATGTPVPSSPSVSTPARPDAEEEEAEVEAVESVDASSRNGEDAPFSHERVQTSTPASPEECQILTPASPEECQILTPASPEEVRVKQADAGLSVLKIPSSEQGAVDSVKMVGDGEDEAPQEVVPSTPRSPTGETAEEPEFKRVLSVPHRSKFAAGIVPFEDTPEYTDVAEATGTYLRIRDLLKCSPRNQAKNNK